MRIAIQNNKHRFHPFWVEYCEENNIQYKIVDCYKNNIISKLNDCDALMWHHVQTGTKDVIFAKQLLFSLEQTGMVVFPNFRTAWHFDDKLGQKYLLERLDIPFIQTYVFYDKREAMQWAETTSYPKVFKLRGGAGSVNVSLIKTEKQAKKIIRRAFGNGISQYDAKGSLNERIRKFRKGLAPSSEIAKGLIRLFKPPQYAKVIGNSVGHVYFQDFIPENDHDIRIIIIDEKAFGIKRVVRDGDFRASGSGHTLYERKHFREDVIDLSFKINDQIKSQSLAIDYVFDNGQPKVVEISYGFIKKVYDPCVGYWDRDLNFYEGKINPCGWMVDTVVKEVNKKVSKVD